jgi:hypothetical protein
MMTVVFSWGSVFGASCLAVLNLGELFDWHVLKFCFYTFTD